MDPLILFDGPLLNSQVRARYTSLLNPQVEPVNSRGVLKKKPIMLRFKYNI